jgi:hypothetical protein
MGEAGNFLTGAFLAASFFVTFPNCHVTIGQRDTLASWSDADLENPHGG